MSTVLSKIRSMNASMARDIEFHNLASTFNELRDAVILVPNQEQYASLDEAALLLQIVGLRSEVGYPVEALDAYFSERIAQQIDSRTRQMYGPQVFQFDQSNPEFYKLFVNDKSNSTRVLGVDEGPNNNWFWTVLSAVRPLKSTSVQTCVGQKYKVDDCRKLKSKQNNTFAKDKLKVLCSYVCRGLLTLDQGQDISNDLGLLVGEFQSNRISEEMFVQKVLTLEEKMLTLASNQTK